MSKPDTEAQLNVHINGGWRFVIRSWSEAPDCCAIHYEDGDSKTEPLNLGPPKDARAVAHAILNWCDITESLADSPVPYAGPTCKYCGRPVDKEGQVHAGGCGNIG